jgi:hypothetical protein
MEVAVNGSSGNGIFAAPIHANDRMVAAASAAATQLTTTTAIAAATIGQRHHCRGSHCIILHLTHCHLCQQRPPSTKSTIAAAAINRRFHQQWPPLPLSTTNNDCWLLVVIIIDCVAAAVAGVDGRDSSCCRKQRQWDWANGTYDGIVNGGSSWWRWQQWHIYHRLPQQQPPPSPSLPLPSVEATRLILLDKPNWDLR